jgi:hypothetical protein
MKNALLAKVISAVPIERVDTTVGDGSLPQVGDIAEVDHMFTSSSGEQMHIVVCRAPDGHLRWVADMLASEISTVPRPHSGT